MKLNYSVPQHLISSPKELKSNYKVWVAYCFVIMIAVMNASFEARASLSQKPLPPLISQGETLGSFDEVLSKLNQSKPSLIDFTPNGNFIVFAVDNTIQMWDIRSGTLVKEYQDKTIRNGYTSVSVSPNAHLIASGCWDGSIIIWDISSGKIIHRFNKHSNYYVNSIQFSPDSKTLITTSPDNQVRLWGADSGKTVQLLKGNGKRVSSISFHPQGSLILITTDDGIVHLWNIYTGKEVTKLSTTPVETAESLKKKEETALKATEKIYGALRDLTPELFENSAVKKQLEMTREMQQAQFSQKRKYVQYFPLAQSAQFSPDGKKMIILSGSGQVVWLWDISINRHSHQLTRNNPRRLFYGKTIGALSFTPDSMQLAVNIRNSSIEIWNIKDASIGMWDIKKNRESVTFQTSSSSPISHYKFSPNGRTLATQTFINKTIQIWDVSTGLKLRQLSSRHTNQLDQAYLSPSGRYLLTIMDNHIARLWDVEKGRPVRDFTMGVKTASFSPDEKMLAIGYEDEKVRLWRIKFGKLISELPKLRSNSVCFRPRGKMIAGESLWEAITILDAHSGRKLRKTGMGENPFAKGLPNNPCPVSLLLHLNYQQGEFEALIQNVWGQRELRSIKINIIGDKNSSHDPRGITQLSLDGRRLFVPMRSSIQVFDAFSGKKLYKLNLKVNKLSSHSSQASSNLSPPGLIINHSGNIIITTNNETWNGELTDSTFWKIEPGLAVKKFQINKLDGWFGSFVFNQKKKIVAGMGNDNAVRIWSTINGKEKFLFKPKVTIKRILSFNSDGSLLAAQSRNGSVILWDTITGKEKALFFSKDKLWLSYNAENKKWLRGDDGRMFFPAILPKRADYDAEYQGEISVEILNKLVVSNGRSSTLKLRLHNEGLSHIYWLKISQHNAMNSPFRISDPAQTMRLATGATVEMNLSVVPLTTKRIGQQNFMHLRLEGAYLKPLIVNVPVVWDKRP